MCCEDGVIHLQLFKGIQEIVCLFCWISLDFFSHLIIFAANGSVQNHDIMFCNVFCSSFSTHFFLGVNGASLVIYRLNFVLVLRGNATCAGTIYIVHHS